MTALRPFTTSDWEAFAGCESEQPEIAELGADLTLILDASTVYLVQNPSVEDPWSMTFNSPGLARKVAEVILNHAMRFQEPLN